MKDYKNNPLLGKYIVYRFGEQTYDDEYWGLILNRLDANGPTRIYEEEYDEVGLNQSQGLVKLLKKLNVNEVTTIVNCYEEFLGIKYEWISCQEENDNEKEIELWVEYTPLEEDHEEYNWLSDNGIRIIEFDYEQYKKSKKK